MERDNAIIFLSMLVRIGVISEDKAISFIIVTDDNARKLLDDVRKGDHSIGETSSRIEEAAHRHLHNKEGLPYPGECAH